MIARNKEGVFYFGFCVGGIVLGMLVGWIAVLLTVDPLKYDLLISAVLAMIEGGLAGFLVGSVAGPVVYSLNPHNLFRA